MINWNVLIELFDERGARGLFADNLGMEPISTKTKINGRPAEIISFLALEARWQRVAALMSIATKVKLLSTSRNWACVIV